MLFPDTMYWVTITLVILEHCKNILNSYARMKWETYFLIDTAYLAKTNKGISFNDICSSLTPIDFIPSN